MNVVIYWRNLLIGSVMNEVVYLLSGSFLPKPSANLNAEVNIRQPR